MFIKAGFSNSYCPNTDHFFDNMIALPNHDELTKEEVRYITESLNFEMSELRKRKLEFNI